MLVTREVVKGDSRLSYWVLHKDIFKNSRWYNG